MTWKGTRSLFIAEARIIEEERGEINEVVLKNALNRILPVNLRETKWLIGKALGEGLLRRTKKFIYETTSTLGGT